MAGKVMVATDGGNTLARAMAAGAGATVVGAMGGATTTQRLMTTGTRVKKV